MSTTDEIKHFNQDRTPEFWALEQPFPGGPNDDNVKTFLKYKVEGSTLLLGLTKKLIDHSDYQMDISPYKMTDSTIKGDWCDNVTYYDNILGDGVLNFTKELEINLLEMCSKYCRRLIVRSFNYKYDWMKIADNFSNEDTLYLKPTWVEKYDENCTFYIWEFHQKS